MDKYLENFHEEKEFITEKFNFPVMNEKVTIQGIGKMTRSEYLVDINKKSYTYIKKMTLQNRLNKNITLLRLDFDGREHTNPDGDLLTDSHIHVYKEGFGASWAYPLDHPFLQTLNPNFNLNKFQTNDNAQLFEAFIEFCNFINNPTYKIRLI